MRRTKLMALPTVRVSIRGEVPDGTAEYTDTKIIRALRRASEPVLDARVRLTVHRDLAVQRPVTAEANLDLRGRAVRVQVDAPTAREAVDLLDARLRQRLDRMARHWQARRGRMPSTEPNEWRHESITMQRPALPPPPAEPRVIRQKSFAPARTTIDEALSELGAMDYTFYLFNEAASGQDAMLYQSESGAAGLRLALVDPSARQPGRSEVSITV